MARGHVSQSRFPGKFHFSASPPHSLVVFQFWADSFIHLFIVLSNMLFQYLPLLALSGAISVTASPTPISNPFSKKPEAEDPASPCPLGSKGGLPLMGWKQTGIFGCGNATAPPSMSAKGLIQMVGGVYGMSGSSEAAGSGPYKSNYTGIDELPRHTIYIPHGVPNGTKIPVIFWGNGACTGWGGWFSKFLEEISSQGYLIVANGSPNAKTMAQMTKGTDIPDAMDWVFKNAGTGLLANADTSKVAVAGQSCGGVQALSASLDSRVTATAIFDSGLINTINTPLFEKLHAPIGWFLGGPTDIAYENVRPFLLYYRPR
jgi:Chlorophyllase